jgi:large subunit ribosomal protein L1
MKKRSKKYNEIKNKIEEKGLNDSFELVKDVSISRFKGSIEVHIALKTSKKENKQNIRGSVFYKNSVGKKKKILLFTDRKDINEKLKKQFDYIGLDEYIKKIQEGWIDFDIAIATPNVMPQIAILGKILGPRSLMPNPKLGTVTDNLEGILNEYKSGKFDYKSDQMGNIHTIIGNVDNTKEELLDNFSDLMKSILNVTGKPIQSAFKSIYLAPTIGPSIKLENDDIIKLLS